LEVLHTILRNKKNMFCYSIIFFFHFDSNTNTARLINSSSN
jgi:hypothetical protein